MHLDSDNYSFMFGCVLIMKIKILFLIGFIIIFSLLIVFRNPEVNTVYISGFEEEEKLLREKYPDNKSYTEEELQEREAALDELFKKKVKKLKEQHAIHGEDQ